MKSDQRARAAKKPSRPTELNWAKYRRRDVVERCIGWPKEKGRIGTRYEKLAVNFLQMVKLAMLKRCFT